MITIHIINDIVGLDPHQHAQEASIEIGTQHHVRKQCEEKLEVRGLQARGGPWVLYYYREAAATEFRLHCYTACSEITVCTLSARTVGSMKSARYWRQELGGDIVKFHCYSWQLVQDPDAVGSRCRL